MMDGILLRRVHLDLSLNLVYLHALHRRIQCLTVRELQTLFSDALQHSQRTLSLSALLGVRYERYWAT